MSLSWKVSVFCIIALVCAVLAETPGRPALARRSRLPWRGDDERDYDEYDGFDFGFGRGDGSRGNSDADSGTGSGDGDGDGDGTGGRAGDLDAFRAGIPFNRQKANSARTVHGILAAILFVGVFPLGAILVRVAKRHAWLHGVVQLVALGAYVAAAGLGIWLALYVRVPGADGTANLFQQDDINFHPIIGLLILALLLLQPLWGALHHARYKTLGRRTLWSHLHLWTGRLVIPLGMVNGALGLWRSGTSGTVLISYGVVAGVVWAVWMAFAVVGEVRRRGVVVVGDKGSPVPESPESGRVPSGGSRVSSHGMASRRPTEGSGRAPTEVSRLSSPVPGSRRPSA